MWQKAGQQYDNPSFRCTQSSPDGKGDPERSSDTLCTPTHMELKQSIVMAAKRC